MIHSYSLKTPQERTFAKIQVSGSAMRQATALFLLSIPQILNLHESTVLPVRPKLQVY